MADVRARRRGGVSADATSRGARARRGGGRPHALLCGALPLLPFFAIFAVALRRAAHPAPTSERPLRAAAALVGAAVVGFAIAAAQLAPTLAHLPLSPRALGTSYAFASSYAWPNLSYLATLVVPDLFGVEERARWFGAFNHWEMAAYYVGLWAVLLAPFAICDASRGRRSRPGCCGSRRSSGSRWRSATRDRCTAGSIVMCRSTRRCAAPRARSS